MLLIWRIGEGVSSTVPFRRMFMEKRWRKEERPQLGQFRPL